MKQKKKWVGGWLVGGGGGEYAVVGLTVCVMQNIVCVFGVCVCVFGLFIGIECRTKTFHRIMNNFATCYNH